MAGKIGDFDPRGIVFGIFASAYRGFLKINKNTDFIDLFLGEASGSLSGSAVNEVNFATDEGYIYNSNDPYIHSDGIDNLITIDDNDALDGMDCLTIEAWCYDNNPSGPNGNVITKRGATRPFNLYLYTGGIGVQIHTDLSGGFQTLNVPGVRVLGWSYLAVTWADKDPVLRLYQNGVEIGNIPVAGNNILANTTEIKILQDISSTGTLDGRLGLLTLRNVCLPPTEIVYNYQLGKGLWGLLGVQPETPDSTMKLTDNRIGLKNPYQENFSWMGFVDPSQVDYYEGLLKFSNGEAATGDITGELIDFTVGNGFKAESGGVPAHLLFDGTIGHVQTNHNLLITNDSEFSWTWKVKVGAVGSFQILYGKGNDIDNFVWCGLSDVNKFSLRIEVGGVPYIADSIDTYSVDDKVTVVFEKVGSTLLIIIDGVDVTSGTSTYNGGDITFLNMIIGNWNLSALLWSGLVYSIVIRDICSSINFIKNQLFAAEEDQSGNQINYGGITAKATGTAGVIEYTSTKVFLEAQMNILQLDNSVVVAYPWGTGKFGMFKRNTGVAYTIETFFRVAFEQFFGKKIKSSVIYAFTDAKGGQTSVHGSHINLQNKLEASNFIDGPEAPQDFDAFSGSEWDTVLRSVTVRDVENYKYEGPLINDALQDWADETVDMRNGLILDFHGTETTDYLNVFSIQVGVEIDSDIFNHLHYVGRGVGAGICVGIC